MTREESSSTKNKRLKFNFKILILFYILVYGLAIFQDYLFSNFKSTGFYWSDTLLYNIYWLLFIPFIQLASSIYKNNSIHPKTLLTKLIYVLIFGIVFSILHIFVFTSVFIFLSNIIYPIPHRFSVILKNVISNQSQITIITYLFLPFVIEYLYRKQQQKKDASIHNNITIKNGTRRIKIATNSILFIQTNRPYTTVVTNEQKLLHDESLKKLEELLNTQVFIRVHRSTIINKNHLTEIKSRKNGDYDGILTNGEIIRFSRHYRQNWNMLLNH